MSMEGGGAILGILTKTFLHLKGFWYAIYYLLTQGILTLNVVTKIGVDPGEHMILTLKP